MLLFQAIVTLILGIVFFSQVIGIDNQKIDNYEISLEESDTTTQPQLRIGPAEIKARYSTASYILLFISLIELIIITRLLT